MAKFYGNSSVAVLTAKKPNQRRLDHNRLVGSHASDELKQYKEMKTTKQKVKKVCG